MRFWIIRNRPPRISRIAGKAVRWTTGATTFAIALAIAAVILPTTPLGGSAADGCAAAGVLGASFDGNLKKVHLLEDGPYNTYTRAGLPPTPIAMPGRASLRSAMHPAKTDALYYVSRGDGSSQFSRNLDEHNRAVSKYQLKGR